MIQAQFKKQNGHFLAFEISGHAGYAKSGQDIVCAAVSSATQLIVNMMDKFDCRPVVSAEGDTVKCRITASENTASAMLELFMQHLESIAEEFPKTINITISEV